MVHLLFIILQYCCYCLRVRVPTDSRCTTTMGGKATHRDHSIKQMLRPKTTFSLTREVFVTVCCRRNPIKSIMLVWLTKAKDGLDTIRWVCRWAGHHIGSDRIKSKIVCLFYKTTAASCSIIASQRGAQQPWTGRTWMAPKTTDPLESPEGERCRDSSSLAANHGGGLPLKQKSSQAAGVNAEAWTFLPFPTDPLIM